MKKNLAWKDEAQARNLVWKDEQQQRQWIDEVEQVSSVSQGPEPSLLEKAEDAAKRIGGTIGMGLAKGANQIGALGADLLMAPYDLVRGAVDPNYENNPYEKGIMPRFKQHEGLWDQTMGKAGQDAFDFKGTPAEHYTGAMAEVIPSMIIGGGMTKAAGLTPEIEGLAKVAGEKIGSNLLGKGAESAIKDIPDAVNTWLLAEEAKPENERTPLPEWVAEWIGGNLAVKGLTKAAGAGLRAIKGTPAGEIIPENIAHDQAAATGDVIPVAKAPTGGAQAAQIPGKMEELSNGQRVRSLGVTAAKSDVTTPETKQGLIDEMIPEGLGAYERISNTDTQDAARQLIDQDTDAVTRRILSNEPSTATDNAAGMLLVQRAQETGDYAKAIDIVEALARKATEQGQSIQALSMWARLTPEGMLRAAQKTVDQANNELIRAGGKAKYKVTPEVADKINSIMNEIQSLPEGRAKQLKIAEALRTVQEQIPAGLGRKASTIQAMGQLLNAKTIGRNIVGNAGFQGLENISDVIGTGIDTGISLVTGQRSKALPSLGTQGRGLVQGFKEGAEDALLGVDTGAAAGKFDLPQGRTFTKGPLAGAEKTLNLTLRAPDRAFYQAAYDESLRQQMAAAAKSGKVLNEPTEAMREIAHHDGLVRTFQDENVASKFFVGLKRLLNGGKDFGFGDFIVKYPRVPANLLMRGIEYSPAGIVKTIIEASKPLMGREFNQRAFVESFSRAITGTTLGVGTGAALHKMGIISGGPDKNRNLENLKQQSGGLSQYRLNASGLKRLVLSGFDSDEAKIRPGDITVSYDWFQPAAIALALGADWDANRGQAQGVTGTLMKAFTTGTNALASGVNTLADQSLFTGIETLTGTKDKAQAIADVLEGVPASFVPTLLNQVRQYVDNQKRNTYGTSTLQTATNKAINKIPGMNTQLPQAYGTLGQPLTAYQPGSPLTTNNVFNTFFNPAFVNRYNPSTEAKMVLDMYANNGEKGQIPKVISKYFTVGGKRIDLTAEEYSQMQQLVGQATREGFTRIPTDISGDHKLRRMAAIMEDAGRDARIGVLQGRGLSIPATWQVKPGGPKYLLKAIENGDQAAIEKGTMAYVRNGGNAHNIYTYCSDSGFMDENGQPTPTMQRALALVWENQGKKQASSAAYSFLLDACKENNEQEARRWAGVIKGMGKSWKNVENSIRSRSVTDKRNTKTPTMQEIYQGGYKIDPLTIQRAQWAMAQ